MAPDGTAIIAPCYFLIVLVIIIPIDKNLTYPFKHSHSLSSDALHSVSPKVKYKGMFNNLTHMWVIWEEEMQVIRKDYASLPKLKCFFPQKKDDSPGKEFGLK